MPLRVVQDKQADKGMMESKKPKARDIAELATSVTSLAEVQCLVPGCKSRFTFPWGAYDVPGEVRAGVCSPECNEAYRKIISVIEYKVPETVPVEEKP
ncbi:MAG: hypothetical protein WA082_04085 [Candidatus Moraniibacteriota bacterium]